MGCADWNFYDLDPAAIIYELLPCPDLTYWFHRAALLKVVQVFIVRDAAKLTGKKR